MKLNVPDRLTLKQLLNQIKTNWLTWDMVNKVISRLSIEDKEFKEFDIKEKGTQIKWNLKGLQEKEIEIGEKVTDIIVSELNKRNDTPPPEGGLEQKQLSLYKKFVVDKKPT